MRNEGRENVTDVVVHNEIGNVVELGRVARDDDKTCTVAFGNEREAGRRPDHQRRTDRDEKIADFASSCARRIGASGIDWPNDTVAVLM